MLLQTAQAATSSFAERVGVFHGFETSAIGIMFALNGIISLPAPLLAGLLEKRLPAVAVAITILVIHGLCSITLTQTGDFAVYSAAFMLMIFSTSSAIRSSSACSPGSILPVA